MAIDVPFGSLDASPDWQDQEAQANLAAIEAAKPKPARSWYDTAMDVGRMPGRMLGALTSSPASPEADQAAMSPETFVNPLVKNTADAVGGAIKSGVTAPGDALAGKIPQYDAEGHTSPEMIQRGFDTAAVAGGGSVAGTAEKAASTPGADARVLGIKVRPAAELASDSAKPGAAVAAAEHAPPFYSGLERAVDAIPQEKMTGAQWLGTLQNRPGVKPEELDWTGVRQLLQDHGDNPLPKDQLQDHLENNKVQIGEVTKGSDFNKLPPDEQYQLIDRYADDRDTRPNHVDTTDPHFLDYVAKYTPSGAKYADYQLPGGENYREKLLTLPSKELGPITREEGLAEAQMFSKSIGEDWNKLSSAQQNHYIEAAQRKLHQDRSDAGGFDNRQQYVSSHWDEPNVLAHLRMNDREMTDPGAFVLRNRTSGNTTKAFPSEAEAQAHLQTLPEKLQPNLDVVPSDKGIPKKSLHLEEIQSDWHQEGRREGYQSDNKLTPEETARSKYNRMYGEGSWDRAPEDTRSNWVRDAASAGGMRVGVPDAPFKKNWHELALKRALHEAAEGGYDRLSWTPGEAQAARYDLSKQISEVRWNSATHDLQAKDHQGKVVIRQKAAPDKLPDIIGKEAADRIVNKPTSQEAVTGNGTMAHLLTGLDLKVGGEGMKGFYDKIVPDYLNKVGKPHGAQVKRGSLGTEVRMYDNEGKPGASFPNMYAAQQWLKKNPQAAEYWSPREGGQAVHYMDITPSLRQHLLTRGMPLFEDSSSGAAVAAASHAGEPNVARSVRPGGGGGAGGVAEAQGTAARLAGTVKPLEGLPQKPIAVGGGAYVPGPNQSIHQVAKDYMASTGRPYERVDRYHPIDPGHAANIAKAYEEMPHAPNDPKVKASYNALIKETTDQYRALKKSGLKIEAIEPGMKDPYAESPRLAHKDVAENNHLWFFPTESGFGTDEASGAAAAAQAGGAHPMLAKTGEKLGNRELLANDLFRVVHDYFGHLKEGNGFRAAGEDNAWRTHSKMYSDLAKPAMTTETRGQNSWLNYGPHGEFNRTANAADTHYAEQKVGVMPDWTMRDRAHPLQRIVANPDDASYPGAKYPQYAEQYPPVGPPALMDKKTMKPIDGVKGKAAQKLVDQGKAYWGKQNTPEAQVFQKDRAAIQKDMEAKGYEPYFNPAERAHVDPANHPTPLDMTKDALPAKQATIDKYREMFNTPGARKRLQKAFDEGSKINGAKDWYAMRQLEDQYVKHLGPEEGRARFAREFAHTMAATTGGADPTSNLLLAHYVQWAAKNKGSIPEASYEHPFPIGGRYVSGNIDQFRKMPEGGFTENNPKRHDFAHAFLGHTNKATMDEQMSGGLVPGMALPPGDSYGVAAKVVHELAAKNGVHPRDFQDVAWAGLKKLKTEAGGKKFEYKGPMIQDVNDAIERTHRLTGMSRNDIVKRGLVKKEIPLYAGGSPVPLGSLHPDDDK